MADSKKSSSSSDDAGQAEVAKAVEAEQEQGFRGVEVDETPDEHYSVSGVIAGKPTPENNEGSDA